MPGAIEEDGGLASPEALGVSIADVLNAPTEPPPIEAEGATPAEAPEAPAAEDERGFGDELAELELAAQPEATPEAPQAEDPYETRFAALEEQNRQLTAALQQARQPQQQQWPAPPWAYQQQPVPKTFDQRVDERVKSLAEKHNYDPKDPSLHMFAAQQVQTEDLRQQMVAQQQFVQEAQTQANIAQNQRDMDAAFSSDPLLNQLSRSDPQLGATLYESAFAVWLAQGGRDARGAAAHLSHAIQAATKQAVEQRLASVREKSKGRPITSTGRTVSLAETPPGTNTIKFRPRNPAKAVDEAAEQAARYLKRMGIE